jgi:tetratricopeptide (TPR) repeat protein
VLYLQARDRLGRSGCEGRAPNVLLQRSLERDPGYAPAWVALGWANYGLASTCGLGPEHYAEALIAADEALQRAPDSLPAVALKATVQVETGAAGDALELLNDYLERFPGSAALHYAASYAAYYLGDLELSELELNKTLQLDPLFMTAEGWTPNVLLYGQRYAEFLELLPATRSTLFHFYRGYALLRMGQVDAARQPLSAGYSENPTDVFGRLSGALLAVLDENPATAIAILDTLAHERRTHGVADGEIAFRLAQLAALAGDAARAQEQLTTAADMGFQCPACITNDPLLRALAGATSEAETLLEQ